MRLGGVLVALYILSPTVANWMIANVGDCSPHGPCTLPVGFGLYGPSGVMVVGATLVLRDIVQDILGRSAAIGAILAGSVVAAFIAPPHIVLASGLAFLMSELADMLVYTPLRERRLLVAVLLSGAVGSLVDSVVFLYLAFGDLGFVVGQTVGKLWMSLLAVPLIAYLRRRRA